MVKRLIINQWRETTRSSVWTRNLVGNILIGLLYFILALNFLIIGLQVDKVFSEIAPGKNPVVLFNGILIYYLLFDFLIRLALQKNHGLVVKPYLSLPVKRSTLINYLLSKSFFSLFNFLPLFLVIPFVAEEVIPAYSVVQGLAWLACFIFFLLINCFLVAYIKKSSFKNSRAGLAAFVILAAAVLSDYYNLFSISKFSSDLFGIFISAPEFVLILGAVFFLVYSANYRLLLNNFYLESFTFQKKFRFGSFKLFDILESFGEVGVYISLELKLLLRNKRSRNILVYSFVMIAIGLLIYPTYETRDIYPPPTKRTLQKIEVYKLQMKNNPESAKVTFKVYANNIPFGATVFVAGSQGVLKNWQPYGMPLAKDKNGDWTGSLPVNKNTVLTYKVTLGNWSAQRLNSDGSIPANSVLNVRGDTTVVVNAEKWGVPQMPVTSLIMLIYIGIAITGMFLLTYGQFILSWESSYFDAIITKKINFLNYLKAKYLLMVSVGCVFFVLSLPYGYFGARVIAINFAAFLYNIGVNTFMLMYLATFNRKRFDLNIGMMSQQGKGASQYIAGIPTLLIPTAIFLPFALLNNINEALVLLGAIGLIGIFFQKQIMNFIIAQFYKQKYKMAAGFRQLY